MIDSSRVVLFAAPFALLLATSAFPSTARAQDASPPAEHAKPSAETKFEATRVRGIVFGEDALPKAGVEVRLGTQSVTTGPDGAFELAVPSGTHELEIEVSPDRRATRSIVVGDVELEVLVSLQPSGAEFDVEGEPASATVEEATPREEEPEVAATGVLEGQVLSLEDGQPVAGAKIYVRGQREHAVTDTEGRFILELPQGAHDLAVVHPDYSAYDRRGVRVEGGQAQAVKLELSPSSVTLDDFTISAPRIEGGRVELLAERRESKAVSEVLGAEQMSKSGASDAADALSRVTGVTVVGGRYVYVRGLGERYSSTLLNGSSLPSPEPEKRVVPLDLFPTDLLESIVIQKTFTPDMPGEFGGGVVMLRTRRFPATFEADLSLSTGYDTATTFREGLHYQGGRLDFFGVDDGTRELPDIVREASEEAPLQETDIFGSPGYEPEELERFGEAMPNNWNISKRRTRPDLGLSGSIGNSFALGDWTAGYRFGLTFDNESDHQLREQNYYVVGAGGQLERSNSYAFTTTTNTAILGAILASGIEFGEHDRIVLTSLLNRVTDDEARIYEGFNRDVDSTIRVSRLRWLERQLLYEQLRGEHLLEDFFDLGIDWRYVYSQARRDEPDRRETRYDLRPSGEFQLSDRPEGNSRVFSDLVDHNHDFGAGFTLPFDVWRGLEASAKTGFDVTLKNRRVDTRRFKYFGDVLDPELFTQSPEVIFADENVGPDGLQFLEITRPTDNYFAAQQILAGYAMTTVPIAESLEVLGGARIEHSDQVVETFEPFNPEAEVSRAQLRTTDVLPALTTTWSASETMKVRAAMSRTVSRPDFRELSPQLFNDVTGGLAVQGNPDLERALITHIDTRWEWYPTASETLSAGLFYKHFDRPIESILVPGAQQLKTFANAESAQNLGVEFEARQQLGFLAQAMRDFYVATNLSLVYSRIELSEDQGIQTSQRRPLQGQSPYVINAQLGFDDADAGTSVAALFNLIGPRISEVGALGAPDIYERPAPRLDLVWRQALGAGFKLGLKGTNLLNPRVQFTQGDQVALVYRRGIGFSASLGYDF